MSPRHLRAVFVALVFGCSPSSPPAPPARDAGVDAFDAAGRQDVAVVMEDTGARDAADGGPRVVENLDDLIMPILAASAAPAMGAAVSDGDGLVALGAVGLRRAGDAAMVTHDDKWHLGSCTKAMTGTLIARLVEAGQAEWNTTIAGVFPEAASSPFASVTLDELLAHRGGFVEQIPEAIWDEILTQPNVRAQRRRMVTLVLGTTPVSPPSTGFGYSNVGYMVAGAMLEEVLDRSWEELITEHVFAPLGMESCAFGVADADGDLEEPWGHAPYMGVLESVNDDNPAAFGPAGTVHCSLTDWAKFAHVHATQEGSFLEAATYERLHAPLPADGDYRAGWNITERSWARGIALNHSGSNTLNYAIVWVAPMTGHAFLATANIDDNDIPLQLDELISQLVSRYSP